VATGDVTAVLLTVDEPYAARARGSAERQTLAFADVVVVRGVVPFHRALNQGAAQVRTPYFMQIDADMVLDPTCCADLRAAIAARAGVVVGHLRDAMLGRIAGIKLFRSACFAPDQFPDSISPDTDFYNAIERRGWSTVYAIQPAAVTGDWPHVFGEHAPDYSSLYTFRKFTLLGARHRYRRAAVQVRQLLHRLHNSPHPMARIGVIGTAYGIGLPTLHDALTPAEGSPEHARLEQFLARCRGEAAPPAALRDVAALAIPQAWSAGCRCGATLYRDEAAAVFVAAVRHLCDALSDVRGTPALVALAGLCHGLLAERVDEAAASAALAQVNTVLPAPYRMPAIAVA